MRLFIAEKHDVAKPLAETLGNASRKQGYYDCGGDIVTHAIGHILELFDPEDYDERFAKWTLDDLPIVQREMRLKPISSKKKQLSVILDLLKKADSVVHVGDPDDEGQLIIDEILAYAKYKGPVSRLLMSDIIPKNIKKALDVMVDNSKFKALSSAARARSYGDQFFGYNMTRAFTLSARKQGYDGLLSVGRVQTPILALVVNRDHLHENHVKQYYHTVDAEITIDTHKIKANLVIPEDATTDDEGRIIDKPYCETIKVACDGESASIVSAETKRLTIEPPLPYNLLLLQADASELFDFSSSKTKDITQSLRDKHGLISYNRSNVCYLTDEHHEEASGVIDAVLENMPGFKKQAAVLDISIKSKAFNSKYVEVHHGIIPTIGKPIMTTLSAGEEKIYDLICRRYLMQFIKAAEYDQFILNMNVKDHSFKSSCRAMIEAGWQVLKRSPPKSIEDETETELEGNWTTLAEGQVGVCEKVLIKDCETKPVKRYTEKSLLIDLTRVSKYVQDEHIKKLLKAKDADIKGEQGGIGTPATRDTMIKNLFDRGFIEKQGKYFLSTPLGRELISILPDIMTKPDMTALWHEQQKNIENGSQSVDEFLDGLESFVAQEIASVKSNGVTLTLDIELISCPNCATGSLKKRPGKFGAYWSCGNYPDCKSTFKDVKNKPQLEKPPQPAVSDEHLCPSCNSGLVKRPSKKKKGKPQTHWWGCSNFPKCKETFFDKGGKPNMDVKKAVG